MRKGGNRAWPSGAYQPPSDNIATVRFGQVLGQQRQRLALGTGQVILQSNGGSTGDHAINQYLAGDFLCGLHAGGKLNDEITDAENVLGLKTDGGSTIGGNVPCQQHVAVVGGGQFECTVPVQFATDGGVNGFREAGLRSPVLKQPNLNGLILRNGGIHCPHTVTGATGGQAEKQ